MGYPKVIGAGACIYSLGFPSVIGGAVIAAKCDAGNAAKRIADIATCCDCNMGHAVFATCCDCVILHLHHLLGYWQLLSLRHFAVFATWGSRRS